MNRRVSSERSPWETAWAVFAYTDDNHFYYMAFKTNGWELGKVDPAYPGGQRFLADDTTVPTPVGTPRRFHIRQQGVTITVKLDDTTLTTFTDTERPYLRGRIGFYTEDAKVAFDNVSGAITDDFEGHRPMLLRDGGRIGSMWVAPYTGFGLAAVASLAAAERLP